MHVVCVCVWLCCAVLPAACEACVWRKGKGSMTLQERLSQGSNAPLVALVGAWQLYTQLAWVLWSWQEHGAASSGLNAQFMDWREAVVNSEVDVVADNRKCFQDRQTSDEGYP